MWIAVKRGETMAKVVVVTGGNSGIGLAAATELAGSGCVVCLACRNQDKAALAMASIRQRHPDARVEVYSLDLASFDSIRRFVAMFVAKHPALDVLVNNAGAAPLKLGHTAEGFELQFGGNYLGPFLLTHLLVPALARAAQVNGGARIIHLASIAHNVGKIDEATFRDRKPYSVAAAYGQSKLGNLMFNFALARRLPPGVTTHALHPGAVASDIYRDFPRLVYAVMRPFMITAERAGKLIADTALSSTYIDRSGSYESVQKPHLVSRIARNEEGQEQLYAQSCALAGVQGLPLQANSHRLAA